MIQRVALAAISELILGKVMGNFNFDLERMKAAVESKRIPIPPEALTSEEAFDKWLNEDNDEPTN